MGNVGPHDAGDLTRRRRPLDGDAVSCRVAAAAARVVAGTHTITVGTIGFAADRLADAAVCLDLTPAPTAGFIVELLGVRPWNCCPAAFFVPVSGLARPGHLK